MNTDKTENREILDTRSMIENSFFDNLRLKPNSKPIPREIKETSSNLVINDTESLLLDLFEVRDGLVEIFKRNGVAEKGGDLIVGQIDKVGSCIRKLGGAVDKFDPFSAISGLRDPDLKLNAQRVIENTKQAYTLGKISGDKVSSDGKTINISFSGINGKTSYKAVGTIVANKYWNGNEGIDYIYSEGSGKISVKAINDNGKWIDKSSDYNISWELFEQDKNVEVIKEASEKSNEIKKEAEKPTENNNIDEEIGDFNIGEK